MKQSFKDWWTGFLDLDKMGKQIQRSYNNYCIYYDKQLADYEVILNKVNKLNVFLDRF